MQPPAKSSFDRAGAKAAGYSDAEIDAYLAQEAQSAQATAPARGAAPSAAVPAAREGLTPGEYAVGATRAFMNRLTMNQYPKIIGKLNEMSGMGSAKEDAEKLAEYLADFKRRARGTAAAAEVAGEVAPYFLGGAGVLRAAGAPKAMASAYQAVKKAPILGRLLPASGVTAAEIAAIEGTRGAVEEKGSIDAEPTATDRATGAAKRIATSLPLGRFGEVVGTALASRVGPTIGKLATDAKEATKKSGEVFGAFHSSPDAQLTPKLAQLWKKSSLLRETMTKINEEQGLGVLDPKALHQTYSEIAASVANTPKAAAIYRDVLNPLREAIDEAASVPLSPLIADYAEKKGVEGAIDLGEKAARYIRSGVGRPGVSSPEAVIRAGQRATQAERDAMAQSILAALAARSESPAGQTVFGTAKNLLGSFGRYGTASDVINKVGGRLSPAQQRAVRGGTVFAASENPFDRR